jgi:aspartokinase
MDKEQVQEVVKIINEANSGNWIPMAVVSSLFGIIIVLLLYIYNRDRKISVYKHRDIEEIQSRLSSNNEKLTILVNRHDVKLEEHDKRLAKIER